MSRTEIAPETPFEQNAREEELFHRKWEAVCDCIGALNEYFNHQDGKNGPLWNASSVKALVVRTAKVLDMQRTL